jgi:hypothetical protein
MANLKKILKNKINRSISLIIVLIFFLVYKIENVIYILIARRKYRIARDPII